MKKHIGQNCLITTSQWFVAPDGCEYRAVYGKLIAIHEAGKTLGFIPNRSHANWFIEIGNMIIMGCQVMYIAACKDEPNFGLAKAWSSKSDNSGIAEYETPTKIYNASLS